MSALMERKRDKTIDRESLKTLVTAFGPREAARQANMNPNTVLSLARRHRWKRADASQINAIANPQELAPTSASGSPKPNSPSESICTQSPSEALRSSLTRLKARSENGLSVYAARSAEQLAGLADEHLLGRSKQAKDIADVHRSIWPNEQGRNDILQIAVLVQSQDK